MVRFILNGMLSVFEYSTRIMMVAFWGTESWLIVGNDDLGPGAALKSGRECRRNGWLCVRGYHGLYAALRSALDTKDVYDLALEATMGFTLLFKVFFGGGKIGLYPGSGL